MEATGAHFSPRNLGTFFSKSEVFGKMNLRFWKMNVGFWKKVSLCGFSKCDLKKKTT